jgi:uncharacterized protein YeaO (DUF488 family)
MKTVIHIKRVYDAPSKDDGFRVLVDRLWPRGLTKHAVKMDLWAKSLTPSHALRKWFHQEPDRQEEFARKLRMEFLERQDDLDEVLAAIKGQGVVALLTASRETETGHSPIIKSWLQSHLSTITD